MKRRYSLTHINDARDSLAKKNMGIVWQDNTQNYRVYFKRVPWKMSDKKTFLWDYETKDLTAAIRVGLAMAKAYSESGDNGLRKLFESLK